MAYVVNFTEFPRNVAAKSTSAFLRIMSAEKVVSAGKSFHTVSTSDETTTESPATGSPLLQFSATENLSPPSTPGDPRNTVVFANSEDVRAKTMESTSNLLHLASVVFENLCIFMGSFPYWRFCPLLYFTHRRRDNPTKWWDCRGGAWRFSLNYGSGKRTQCLTSKTNSRSQAPQSYHNA